MLQKDDREHPLPEPWRGKFREVAKAFASGDFQLRRARVDGVAPVDLATADNIAANVAAYGQRLAPLDDAIWECSIYRWMGGYWQVLVDLTAEDETVSDLTLHARIYAADSFRLKIDSVFVP